MDSKSQGKKKLKKILLCLLLCLMVIIPVVIAEETDAVQDSATVMTESSSEPEETKNVESEGNTAENGTDSSPEGEQPEETEEAVPAEEKQTDEEDSPQEQLPPVQSEILKINKHGNVVLKLTGNELENLGYMYGDVLDEKLEIRLFRFPSVQVIRM